MRALQISIGVLAAAVLTAAQTSPKERCTQVGRPLFLTAVPEASGVADAAGGLWTHNDSGPPVLFRVDGAGHTTRVAVPNAIVDDWEDLAGGPCTSGTCLYIADIGDNNRSRERITIYQVPPPVPEGNSSTGPATPLHLKYPDHPHDAEGLLVTRHGTFVITKEVPPQVYHVPAQSRAAETLTLRLFRTLNLQERITGAAVSPNQRWVVLRSKSTLFVYAMEDFLKSGDGSRVDLSALGEPQGEGVTFAGDGTLVLASEAGGKKHGGALTRVRCAFMN